MDPRLGLILQMLSLIGIPTLIICGYKWIGNQIKENQAVESGTRALLSDRITQIYYTSMEKGYCRMYFRESVDTMFKQYKALGGNGHIQDLYNKIMVLPTEPPKRKG